MNYKERLDSIANEIEKIIISNGGKFFETEDFGWSNKRFRSDVFRLAHIERYSDKNLEVLHITCFPTENYQHPIFGFDIICTEKKPLAAFMDWSPVDNSLNYKSSFDFSIQYPLPQWANEIFSSTPMAVIPNDSELEKLSNIVLYSFEMYLTILRGVRTAEYRSEFIINAQNRYCENQQKNERTFNVLKAKLGEEKARYFMQNILFPKI